MTDLREPGYDVIGDVHGEGTKLERLLTNMGYTNERGYYAHPTRKAIFVGDLVDRGPEQLLAVRTAKAMADAGTATVVMGNHEFNAIAFHTPHPYRPGQYLRPHSEKNIDQHGAFLDAVGFQSSDHDEVIDWFRTLPMWAEHDGLRVVHACWHEASMALVYNDPHLDDELLVAASTWGAPEFMAIEVLLKGPDVPIDPGYYDKDNHFRDLARHAWWKPDPDDPLDRIVVPGGVTADAQGAIPWPPADGGARVGRPFIDPYPTGAPPVIFGHYWRTGMPTRTSANTACVDYSACKGGPLVAYRWSEGDPLSDDRFVTS